MHTHLFFIPLLVLIKMINTKESDLTAMRDCPRFNVCDINKCPLHPEFKTLRNSPEDNAVKQKRKCIGSKVFTRIALKHNLTIIDKGKRACFGKGK